MNPTSPPEQVSGARADSTRFPTLIGVLAALSLFALLQAVFILLRQQDFDVNAAIGLAKAGVVAAVPTVLLLALVARLARRWHPAARRGEPRHAFRSLLFGSVAAVGAWMIVDAWVAGPLVATAAEGWIESAAALLAGVAVARRPPSLRTCKRMSFLAIVAFLVLLLPMSGPPSVGSRSGEPAERSGGSRRIAPDEAPDVLLISVDTFRADRIGAYGSPLGLTPEIDRFAAEGLLFERAVSASPWTVPSVASMMTGLPTVGHRAGLPVGSGSAFFRSPLDSTAPTLAERFSAAGYRTRAVVANGFLSPGMGMARGFDEFDSPFLRATGSIFLRDIPLARLAMALYPVDRWGDFRARGLTDKALSILAEESSEPLFLWVHYIDLHTPFQADPNALDLEAWSAEIHQHQARPDADGAVVRDFFAGTSSVRGGTLWLDEADRQRIVDYYDRAVTYSDEELGRLFSAMRAGDRERRIVAALTSDHGEEFWDHGHFEHGHDYYREVTWVPLVFWGPGEVPVRRLSGEPVGLVDVGPTLLELAGLEPPRPAAPDEGESLVSLFEGDRVATVSAEEEGGEPARGRIRFSEGNLYGMPSVLLEHGDWRFILRSHGTGELYHVFEDPFELENRVSLHPDLAASYRALLEPRLASLREGGDGQAPELDPETRKALQSLGYVQ